MNRSEVYSADYCPWCDHAKSLLHARGLNFIEIDISPDPAGTQELIERSGRCTGPQVFIDDVPIGGFDELLMIELPDMPDEDHITATNGGTRP